MAYKSLHDLSPLSATIASPTTLPHAHSIPDTLASSLVFGYIKHAPATEALH